MPDPVVTNWFGDLVSHPVNDIIAVLKDPGRYPSPVRATGRLLNDYFRDLLAEADSATGR
jgi:hypothetical protein